MNISLVGFMGTGKTTIGKKLAVKLGFKFLETDVIIENREGMSISDIFSKKGESFFRNKEKQVLSDIIHNKNDFVLSTGGGIVISPENRKILSDKTTAILLKASVEEIYRRVKNNKERPLLNSSDPFQKISDLMSARQEYYNYFSHKVNTDNKNPEKIVNEIIKILDTLK